MPQACLPMTSPPALIIVSTSETILARTSSAAAGSRSRTMSYVGAVAAIEKHPVGRSDDSSTGANFRCSDPHRDMLARVRWGNVALAATIVGVAVLVAAWPALRAPAPPAPDPAPRPMATTLPTRPTVTTPPPPEFEVRHTAPIAK